MSAINRCVCCGRQVPEGRLTCLECETAADQWFIFRTPELLIAWMRKSAPDTTFEVKMLNNMYKARIIE